MPPLTLRQLEGLAELFEDTVDAATAAVAEAHLALAHQPYAVLAHVPVVAAPAAAIESVQQTVTAAVYASIRSINQVAGAAAGAILTCLDEDGEA